MRNATFFHQYFEPCDIPVPIVIFPILGQNRIARREGIHMMILAPREVPEEIREIALLRKPGKLPAGMQANIDNALNAIVTEQGEESLRRLLRKSDGVQSHRSLHSEQTQLLHARLASRALNRLLVTNMENGDIHTEQCLCDEMMAVAFVRVFFTAHDRRSSFLQYRDKPLDTLLTPRLLLDFGVIHQREEIGVSRWQHAILVACGITWTTAKIFSRWS